MKLINFNILNKKIKISESLSNPNLANQSPKKYQKQEHRDFKNSENVLLIGCRLANSTSNLNKITSDPSSLVQNHIVLKSQTNSPTLTNATTSTQATSSTKVTTALSPPSANGKDDAQMVDFASSIIFPILFILFNIVYWSVYLNMSVLSSN
jgi:hypothetical protein